MTISADFARLKVVTQTADSARTDLIFQINFGNKAKKSSYFRVKERPSFVVYGRKGMFVKYEKDRQEADFKKFYLPDNDDFGFAKPENFGTLTYYDDNGHYHEEAVETVKGDNGRFYDTLYEPLINHKPILVTEEQTFLLMHILEEATKDLK